MRMFGAVSKPAAAAGYSFPPSVAHLWSAGHELADDPSGLALEWSTDTPSWEQASGTGDWEISTAQSKSGSRSMRMFITAGEGGGTHGMRAFASGPFFRDMILDADPIVAVFHSVWWYIPHHYTIIPSGGSFLQFQQHKSRAWSAVGYGDVVHSDPVWALQIENRGGGTGPLHIVLSDKRSEHLHHAGTAGNNDTPAHLDLPIAQWVHIESMILMNTHGVEDGRITFWQDGELIFDEQNVETRHDPAEHTSANPLCDGTADVVESTTNWSDNTYGNDVERTSDGNALVEKFIDDVSYGLERIGHEGNGYAYEFPPPGALWTFTGEDDQIIVNESLAHFHGSTGTGVASISTLAGTAKSGNKSLRIANTLADNEMRMRVEDNIAGGVDVRDYFPMQAYYGGWFYIPVGEGPRGVGGGTATWNVFQFKVFDAESVTGSVTMRLMFLVRADYIPGDDNYQLQFRSELNTADGSWSSDPTVNMADSGDNRIDEGELAHLEVYWDRGTGGGADGALQAWLNGIEFLNVEDIWTDPWWNDTGARYVQNTFNNYMTDGGDTHAQDTAIHWDDCVISTQRIWQGD